MVAYEKCYCGKKTTKKQNKTTLNKNIDCHKYKLEKKQKNMTFQICKIWYLHSYAGYSDKKFASEAKRETNKLHDFHCF